MHSLETFETLSRYLFGVISSVFTDQITHPTLDRVSFSYHFSRPIAIAKAMLTLTLCPDCPSLPLKKTFQALASYRTQTNLASTSSTHAASCLYSSLFLMLAWVGWHPCRLLPPGLDLGGLVSQPDPLISGGLRLTHPNFPAYHAPLP